MVVEFQLSEKSPQQFAGPPSSPSPFVVGFLDQSHSGWGEMRFQCYLKLHFSNAKDDEHF